MPPLWITPTTLSGDTVRLEPLTPAHAPGLLAAATPDLFTFTAQAPFEWSIAGFEAEARRVIAIPNSLAFAIIHLPTGDPIGRTTYMEVRPEHRGLEIGRTWIARAHQGTAVNPEAKFLMLRHAFEALSPPAIRVQLTTGLANLHSQAAITKLGAVHEGVLRKDRVLPDGSFRDSVVFSITDDDWPLVKAGLRARLGTAHPY